MMNEKVNIIMYKTITTNIMVENAKESIEFYQDKLGITPVVTAPNDMNNFDFAIIAKDDISIMFKKSLIEEYPLC